MQYLSQLLKLLMIFFQLKIQDSFFETGLFIAEFLLIKSWKIKLPYTSHLLSIEPVRIHWLTKRCLYYMIYYYYIVFLVSSGKNYEKV